MNASIAQLAAYAGAVLVLFLTPGPVWLAMTARAMSGGFAAAWPLALGVVVGDALWPFLAILGVNALIALYAGFLVALKWVAAATFLLMGVLVLRRANAPIGTDSRLTRPGAWAGFLAGVAVIIGNPKAILFYMGMLPAFFDLSDLTALDVLAIVLISIAVPLVCNLGFAAFVDRTRRLMTSPAALRRMTLAAGWMLIAVGCIVPLT